MTPLSLFLSLSCAPLLPLPPGAAQRARQLLEAGHSLGISPGGVAEIFDVNNHDEVIFMQNRKGFIKLALKTLAGDVLRDGQGHALIIQSSDLDWVIVRGPRLQDGPRTGNIKVGWVGVGTGTTINRPDLAEFMLKQATSDTYLRKMPAVSN